MNTSFTKNLSVIFQDQQLKFDILNKIDVERIGVQPQKAWENLLEAANLVCTILSVFSLLCASNPLTIAFSGIMLLINSIFNVLNLMKKLQLIEDLKKQKKELEEYYKPGGKFEQELKQLADITLQLVENFYMFVVSYRTIVNELVANLDILFLSDWSSNLDYTSYSVLISEQTI